MTQENRWKDYGSRFMVVNAVCSEKGLLNVQANQKLNQSCEDIPAGFPPVLPKDYVEWGEERDTGRMIFAGSWLKAMTDSLMKERLKIGGPSRCVIDVNIYYV